MQTGGRGTCELARRARIRQLTIHDTGTLAHHHVNNGRGLATGSPTLRFEAARDRVVASGDVRMTQKLFFGCSQARME